MEKIETMERIIIDKIEYDLRKIEDYFKDPLGYSVYLLFMLKNNRRSPEIEHLVDWMNSWIDNKINQRTFSRFVDKEFASASFAYFSLKTYKQLRTKVQMQNLKQLTSEFIEDNRFFGNFTLSVIILCMSDIKDEIESYSSVLEWIKNETNKKVVLNDAKNLVLASMLFQKLDSKDYLKKLVDYCWERLSENNVPYYDELYYSYVLWKFKELRGEKDVPKIREFTDSSIRNAERFLREEPVDESLKEVYGVDVKKIPSEINTSKIFLGVYFDLLIDFSQQTIRVAKEELTRKDIPMWIRLGSLISIVFIVSDILILWFSFQWNLIKQVSIDFSKITLSSFVIAAVQFVINVLIFLTVIVLGIISISLFLDIVYRGYGNSQIIKNNLKTRFKKLIVGEILIPLVLGILEAYFGL